MQQIISTRQAILVAILVAATMVTSLGLSSRNMDVIPVADAAQSDYFLKLDGVEGESSDEKHRGEIEILSWSWGATQMGTGGHGGGGGAGKANFQDISFTKVIDSTTEPLMLGSLQGRRIPSATLSVRKAGGGQEDYYKITLKDVMISSFAQAGDGNQETDTFSLNFTKIEFDYKAQSADGSTGNPRHWGWDLKANKKV